MSSAADEIYPVFHAASWQDIPGRGLVVATRLDRDRPNFDELVNATVMITSPIAGRSGLYRIKAVERWAHSIPRRGALCGLLVAAIT